MGTGIDRRCKSFFYSSYRYTSNTSVIKSFAKLMASASLMYEFKCLSPYITFGNSTNDTMFFSDSFLRPGFKACHRSKKHTKVLMPSFPKNLCNYWFKVYIIICDEQEKTNTGKD